MYVHVGSGQLATALIEQELKCLGCHRHTGQLIKAFLKEHGVIHQIDGENILVPSAINAEPAITLDLELGYFPLKFHSHRERGEEINGEESSVSSTSALSASASLYKAATLKLQVVATGLVYRRMLCLPPIPPGFWSKLISLFTQKEEIFLLITAKDTNYTIQVGNNRLRGMIGNVSVEWQYWKTGIMLIANDNVLMRINGLQGIRADGSIIPNAQLKCEFKEGDQWRFIEPHLSESIEIVVPVFYITKVESEPSEPSQHFEQNVMSAKLLAKALEIIDEVLKNHCEHLALNGIYTTDDMLHLIPCPICYGDADHRLQCNSTSEGIKRQSETRFMSLQSRANRSVQVDARVHSMSEQREIHHGALKQSSDNIFTFRVDECIMEILKSHYMKCPRHGKLETILLAPDIVSVIHYRPCQNNYKPFLHSYYYLMSYIKPS